jgi:hypothetical protein
MSHIKHHTNVVMNQHARQANVDFSTRASRDCVVKSRTSILKTGSKDIPSSRPSQNSMKLCISDISTLTPQLPCNASSASDTTTRHLTHWHWHRLPDNVASRSLNDSWRLRRSSLEVERRVAVASGKWSGLDVVMGVWCVVVVD